MIQRIDGSHGNRSHGDVRQNSFSYPMHIRAPADFNQLAALQPIIVIGDRPSSLYSILGYVPGVRAVNIRNLAPGSTLTIGSADWLIVPAIQKTAVWDSDHSISTDYSSGDYAYAYLLPAA